MPSHNTISFDRTDPGPHALVTIDFDFRITPRTTRADGFGVSLLRTSVYGNTGAVGGGAEEPNFTQSLGLGFDIYKNANLNDIGNDAVRANFSNSISLHYDGVVLAQFDATAAGDMADGRWRHARITVRAVAGGSSVTVELNAGGEQVRTIVPGVFVPGAAPYEGRLHIGARCE